MSVIAFPACLNRYHVWISDGVRVFWRLADRMGSELVKRGELRRRSPDQGGGHV